MKKHPDHILDLRGAIPPITLLKVSQVFREMQNQEILEILYRDPDTHRDIFKVLPSYSYELIVIEELEERSSFRVLMKKRTSF